MAKRKKDQTVDPEFESFLKKLGAKLKELRLEEGYTNYMHFAYDHNLSSTQWSKYEAGKEDMRISSLFKALRATGTTFRDFFKDME